MKKILLLLMMLVAGIAAQATLQTPIRFRGMTVTNSGQSMCAGIIESIWGTHQTPTQQGSGYTFSNTVIRGDADITLNGTLNFQQGTSLTDVVTATSFTVTIESRQLWFYGATVKTLSDATVSGCTATVSNNNGMLTVTIPAGKTFGQIVVSYATHEPISSSNTVISGVEDSYLYLGSPIEPEPVVTYNGTVLTKDTDYTLSYWGSNQVGEAQLTVTGTGEYAGDIRKSYTLRDVALRDFNSLGNNTYEIATTTDLDYLALYVKAGNYGNDCEGLTFKQTADIAYSYTTKWENGGENNYTSVGIYGMPFKGTYDGQNYTVSGIRIYKSGESDYDGSQGLFGYVGDGGTVKNVILADANIVGHKNTGGIVGYNSGAIEDCRVESNVLVKTIKETTSLGGIAGICASGGSIYRCTFKGQVQHTSSSSSKIGGVVGKLGNGTVSNCLALGARVIGHDNSGAIVGIITDTSILTANYYHDCIVRNAENSTTVSVSVNVGVGIGDGSADQDGARSVHALTLPDDVTATGETVAIDGATYYAAATTVTLSYSGEMPEGYAPVYTVNGTAIEGNTFEMPAADATITVIITAVDYTITLPAALEHTTVTSDKATAHFGDTVTLTVTPDAGYAVESLTVMNGDTPLEVTAGENNTYTFVMPAADVTVNVEIRRLRYIFDSATGTLALIWGEFNYFDNWDDNDVDKNMVTSVTATDEVRFTGDCAYLFKNFSNCTSMDLSKVNTDSCANMVGMFYGCTQLASLDLSSWNTASVTEMNSMFYECQNLVSLDLSDWNTGNVTNMASMFGLCKKLETLNLSGWNTANVTCMNSMFFHCVSLDTLDLSHFDTGNVTDMGTMFSICMNLASLNLSGWNTGNVTSMSAMFSGCTGLETLDVTHFDTGNVTNMSSMFSGCSGFETLDVTHFETGNVRHMSSMFSGCSGLETLDVTHFDTGNVTDMGSMFSGCRSLETLDVTHFDTGKVGMMYAMFYGCRSLETLDVTHFDTGNVIDMNNMFSDCTSLETLDLSGWNTHIVDINNMFYNCTNLTTIYAGAGWPKRFENSNNVFYGCTSLKGGMGTAFDPDHIDAEYARYDRGEDEHGYLTGVFTLTLPEDVTTTAVATLTHGDVNLYAAGDTITLTYNGEGPDGYGPRYSVNYTDISGDTFTMPFEDATVTYIIGIPIDEVNFPDANFRNWLLEQSYYGSDGVFTDEEIAHIDCIDVSNKNIADLTGIEHFTALEILRCDGNRLTALDVCHNTALEQLECYGNLLDTLDVSQNTALQTLRCDGNRLTALDVCHNTALEQLYCFFNQLDTLDVSHNTALEQLDCFDNQLTTLDVSHNTALTKLRCEGNRLTSIDVSHNTALTGLNCSVNQLTSLDVSQNTELTTLYCYRNQLDTLDVSHNTALTDLDCSNNQLKVLDVSHNTTLERFECSYNHLASLDVCHNTALTTLNCNNNQLTSLDLSHNTALTGLECYGNKINGEGMETLVASLPTVDVDGNYWWENGEFYVIDLDSGTEQNIITTTQVTTARGKNWTVYGRTNNSWEEYDGSEPQEYAPGDLNGDGVVDVADVNICINVILERVTDPAIEALADLNGDGTVDVADVNMIINIILG
ncbi:MAG: BspA family leucine-rich repeat surface protein [Muribaculaceae bacterium]|nr:BspA family leucine-rich repeat surface protein [Muribaculaceae bacterium]